MTFKITKSHLDEDGTLIIDNMELDNWPAKPDTVTITISREDAKYFAIDLLDNWCEPEMRMKDACRAALEGER